MIAALPMYDRPETAAANDRLWALIRRHLGFGPDRLTRGGDVWEIWQSPDLTLAQTCGYPYRARLCDKVTLIGAPDHALPDCPPGHYNSVFVTRSGDAARLPDYAGRRFAYNDAMSQSGWAAPQSHAAGLGFAFTELLQTGAHRESARAVADGRADIAALDSVSWVLMQRYDAFTRDLQEIGRTAPTPALPFIAAPGADRNRLFAALGSAIGALSGADRETLCLHGVVEVSRPAYLAVPTPPDPGRTDFPSF